MMDTTAVHYDYWSGVASIKGKQNRKQSPSCKIKELSAFTSPSNADHQSKLLSCQVLRFKPSLLAVNSFEIGALKSMEMSFELIVV